MNYNELKEQQAPCIDCFFAFSEKQFNEAKAGLEGKKIYSAGQGLYGTQEGITNFLSFYKKLEERISKECDPQEVYNDEFINHECDYVCDDEEAIEKVIQYFGAERAKEVKRRYARKEIALFS
jgi:hypothetical protein